MSIFERIRRMFGGSPANGAGDGSTISCEEALSLVHDYLDGELPDVPRDRVRAHFEVCQRCYPHLRLEESFRVAVRRASAGERAPEGLKERIAELLEEAKAQGS